MLDVTVKTLDSQNHAFNCDPDITVRGFKEFIAETVSVPADSQRLIYCGRVLQDEKKLNDYDVHGKVIHLVQRAPPQPESRSSGNDGQRQSTSSNRPPRAYRGHLNRNTMYLGAMSVPTEVVEGLQTPQLSNTLSNSRLIAASSMLNRAMRLMDRMDDPSVPLHPEPSQRVASETAQAPQEGEDAEIDSNMETSNSTDRSTQGTSDLASAAFSAAALINVRLTNADSGTDGNSINVIDLNSLNPSENQPSENERSQATPSTNTNSNQILPTRMRRSGAVMPRPPQMAELLAKLIETQTRLHPYLERYRILMSTDPVLAPGTGPEGVSDNQKIVDGVSECLHFISHACHALSDIIVDMGQQPPRNLRCRPIIIQHSAILQAGIPIQVESHINLQGRSATNNNDDTENNEATRPSSPMTGGSDESERSPNTNNQQNDQSNTAPPQAQQSLLGALLNLPNNVELSMEISPPTVMEMNANAMDSSDNDQPSANNDNGASILSMAPPLNLIRDVIQNAYDRHQQGGANANAPYVTIIQHDSSAANPAQSTQARSNIGTHPTTSTQTRSTSRPHVLHTASHPLAGMGQHLDFDPFLPCNSHHIRRPDQNAAAQSNSASNGSADTHTQTNGATNSTSRSDSQSQGETSFNIRDSNTGHAEIIAEPVDERFANGIGIAMALGEILQNTPGSASSVRISFLGNSSRPRNSTGSTSNTDNSMLAQLFRAATGQMNQTEGEDFVVDLSMFLLRNITLDGLIQINDGQPGPLISVRRSLREFVEQAFPNESLDTLPEVVVEQIIGSERLYIQNISIPDEQLANTRVDLHKTIEYVLRSCCLNVVKMLLNNDVDDATFAEESVKLIKKLGNQFSALLHYLFKGANARERAMITILNHLTRDLTPNFQRMTEAVLLPRVQAFASRPSPLSLSETSELLVYKDTEPIQTAGTSSTVSEPIPVDKSSVNSEPEPMETDSNDTVSEVNENDFVGEEISENFPGREHLPSDWVPIIAQDVARQRRQQELQNRNGGPLPFSDGYLGGMPSKRRKLIEQQKSPLLVNSSPNHTAITSSVEKLIKEGMSQSGVEEVDGAAAAVASDSNVRSTFAQAIKDSLHPSRLNTPDFPNTKRFPNSSKRFAEQNQSPKKTSE